MNIEDYPAMFERIQRCRHCGQEMGIPPLSYAENPFCPRCIDERVSIGAPGHLAAFRQAGDYVTFINRDQKKPF
jgi:hypothetical protein